MELRKRTRAAPKKMTGLPVLVTSPVDVGRLIRELAAIDDSLRQLNLRSGKAGMKMPKTSKLMDEVVEMNKLNLLYEADRKLLDRALKIIKKDAPVLHMSFSADPSAAFIEKLMIWLRREVHPIVLLTIGLQPNIGAGCIVRTTNHQFDFSLRQNFADKRELLIGKFADKEASS